MKVLGYGALPKRASNQQKIDAKIICPSMLNCRSILGSKMEPKWTPNGAQEGSKIEQKWGPKSASKEYRKKDALGRVGPEKFPPKLPPGEG